MTAHIATVGRRMLSFSTTPERLAHDLGMPEDCAICWAEWELLNPRAPVIRLYVESPQFPPSETKRVLSVTPSSYSARPLIEAVAQRLRRWEWNLEGAR